MNFSLFVNRINKLVVILKSQRLLYSFFRYGVFAAVEHKYLFKYNFSTVVDIGANKGQFSLASRFYLPFASIFAFEPLSNAAAIYKKLFFGDAKIFLFGDAIGPRNESAEMHISGKEDSSSLLPIAVLQSDVYPGTEEISTLSISVATLDRHLSKDDIIAPSLLKLDVQGFELDALRGCESLLNNFDVVYCECSFVELYSGQSFASDIIRWLDERKFGLIGIHNTSFDSSGRAIQADFLFEKRA